MFSVENTGNEKLEEFQIYEDQVSGIVTSNGKEIKGEVESSYLSELYPDDKQYFVVSISTFEDTENIGFKFNDSEFSAERENIINVGKWTNEDEEDKTRFENNEFILKLDLSQSKISGGPIKENDKSYNPELNKIENIKFALKNKKDHLIYIDNLYVSGKLKAYELKERREVSNGPIPLPYTTYEITTKNVSDNYWGEFIDDYVKEEDLKICDGNWGFVLNPNQEIDGTISFDESQLLFFPDKTSKAISVDNIELSNSDGSSSINTEFLDN